MVINLKDIIAETYTNISGYKLYTVIKQNYDKADKIVISFKDVAPMSSSFYNSSIGELIELHGFDSVRSKLKFIELSKPQLQRLQRFIENSRLHA